MVQYHFSISVLPYMDGLADALLVALSDLTGIGDISRLSRSGHADVV